MTADDILYVHVPIDNTLPGHLRHSSCTVKLLERKQVGSLYHIYDGLWLRLMKLVNFQIFLSKKKQYKETHLSHLYINIGLQQSCTVKLISRTILT